MKTTAVKNVHSLERELLDAAGRERTPGKARLHVLSALGLLVLLPRDTSRSETPEGSKGADPSY